MRQKRMGDVVVKEVGSERVLPGVVSDRARRIPVVDAHGVLLGIATLDDLLKALPSDMQLLLEAETGRQPREQTARH